MQNKFSPHKDNENNNNKTILVTIISCYRHVGFICISLSFLCPGPGFQYFGPELEISHVGWEKVGKPQRKSTARFWESPERRGGLQIAFKCNTSSRVHQAITATHSIYWLQFWLWLPAEQIQAQSSHCLQKAALCLAGLVRKKMRSWPPIPVLFPDVFTQVMLH